MFRPFQRLNHNPPHISHHINKISLQTWASRSIHGVEKWENTPTPNGSITCLNLFTFFSFVRGQNYVPRRRHQTWKLGRKQVFYCQQTDWNKKSLQGFSRVPFVMITADLETQSISSLFFSIYRSGKTSLLFPVRPAVTLGGSWRQSDTTQIKVSVSLK